jgi:hypothetical protein
MAFARYAQEIIIGILSENKQGPTIGALSEKKEFMKKRSS